MNNSFGFLKLDKIFETKIVLDMMCFTAIVFGTWNTNKFDMLTTNKIFLSNIQNQVLNFENPSIFTLNDIGEWP